MVGSGKHFNVQNFYDYIQIVTAPVLIHSLLYPLLHVAQYSFADMAGVCNWGGG